MKVTVKQLVYAEILFTVFMMQWMTYIGISNIKILVPDIINLLIFMVGYNTLMQGWSEEQIRPVTLWIGAFWFISFLMSIFAGAIAGPKSVILAIWDMRTFLRPFFYILICYCYFERDDIDKIFNFAYKLQFINVGVTLFMYYVQGIWMDINGGIFAPVQGCNKFSNVYCCLMISWVLAKFIREKATLLQVFLTFGCSIVVAIYAELKFLFIEMILIVLIEIVFSGGGKKVIRTISICALILFLGLYLLMSLFPESFAFLTDQELFMWYAKDMSYSQTEVSVNRLSGFEIVNEHMFQNDGFLKLFGFGWGTTGQIPFIGLYGFVFSAYTSLYYMIFTYAWIYAELGMVGLLMFYGIIFVILIQIFRFCKDDDEGYGLLAKTSCILVIILTIYDSSWITEGVGFMHALGIVGGLVWSKNYD